MGASVRSTSVLGAALRKIHYKEQGRQGVQNYREQATILVAHGLPTRPEYTPSAVTLIVFAAHAGMPLRHTLDVRRPSSTKPPELHFSALVTSEGAERLELARV